MPGRHIKRPRSASKDREDEKIDSGRADVYLLGVTLGLHLLQGSLAHGRGRGLRPRGEPDVDGEGQHAEANRRQETAHDSHNFWRRYRRRHNHGESLSRRKHPRERKQEMKREGVTGGGRGGDGGMSNQDKSETYID